MKALPPGNPAYHLLRVALERFHCRPARLNAADLAQAQRHAQRTLALENRVLASAEAQTIHITRAQLAAALAQMLEHYLNRADYLQDLAANHLDELSLRDAVYREQLFDQVLKSIGAQVAAVSESEVADFYQQQSARFHTPEVRHARHILFTLNPDYPENSRAAIQARMQQLCDQLHQDPAAFGELARRHSECPTALEDGRLGCITRGQLYPELDQVLFNLAAGALSGPVETPMGLHVLWCERIETARMLPLSAVSEQILEQLTVRRVRAAQQCWIKSLNTDGKSMLSSNESPGCY